ncbi:MAG: hypothetical protein RL064_1377 [Bacteroidota bacterium]
MKPLYKYIFLLFILCYFNNEVIAKQKSTKSAQGVKQVKKTGTKKKKSKQAKKKKAKQTKKTAKSKSAKKSVTNTVGYNTIKLADLAEVVSTPVSNPVAEQVPEKTITIISAFKPQLKNVAKMNFGNASFTNDTTTLSLNYQVPSQNLTFQYKPISLVPRAIKLIKPIVSTKSGQLTLGYGNFYQTEVGINYSIIDGKQHTHTITGGYEAYQGLHHLQKANKEVLKYIGDFKLDSVNHLQAQVFYDHHNRYRYGQVSDTSVLPINNFLQKSTTIGASVSWLNFNTNNKLVTFKPTLSFDHFIGESKETNTSFEFVNPMFFTINPSLKVNFDMAYSYSTYQSPAFSKKQNDILRFDPSIEVNLWQANFLLGVSPTISNGAYTMNPNILFKKKLKDTNYVVVAGWNTTYKINKYRDLELYNPWIDAPSDLKNTIKEAKFVELLINASKKLEYSIGVEFNDYKQLPFFNKMEMPIDKSAIGLLYETIFEQRAKTLELVAKARYQISNKLLITGKLNYTQFNSIRINSKPWGITPLNVDVNMTWEATEKLSIDANAQYWSGASFSNDFNGFHTLNNTFILNAGLNYKLSPKWNVWVKGDNLSDKPYERWADYPSLGVQLKAGIVYSFRQ